MRRLLHIALFMLAFAGVMPPSAAARQPPATPRSAGLAGVFGFGWTNGTFLERADGPGEAARNRVQASFGEEGPPDEYFPAAIVPCRWHGGSR